MIVNRLGDRGAVVIHVVFPHKNDTKELDVIR